VALVDGNAPGNSIFSGSVSQANGAAPWVAFSQDFTATSNLTLLTFIDTQGAADAGIYLDDVSVEQLNATATPIPGALPLFAGGLGLLGFFGVKKRRKQSA
jgi:hypothetical protein